MNCFTGIVPSDHIYNTVADIQRQFGDNRLEPHITVTPPALVVELDEWLSAIKNVCSGFSPFIITLPHTGQFGKRVLFIDVVSEPLTELYHQLHNATKRFIKADKGHDELRHYNPHLTLGRKWCGFTQEDFAQMKVITEEYLSKEPVSFNAEYVRVYHKPQAGGRYEKLQDIYL